MKGIKEKQGKQVDMQFSRSTLDHIGETKRDKRNCTAPFCSAKWSEITYLSSKIKEMVKVPIYLEN